jgi:hypothetical protein
MSSLTSNDKYILPQSSVYYKKWTPMMYYPGSEHFYGNDESKFFRKFEIPENLKAFNSSDSEKSDTSSKLTINIL